MRSANITDDFLLRWLYDGFNHEPGTGSTLFVIVGLKSLFALYARLLISTAPVHLRQLSAHDTGRKVVKGSNPKKDIRKWLWIKEHLPSDVNVHLLIFL